MGTRRHEVQRLGTLDVGNLPQKRLPSSSVDTNQFSPLGVAQVFEIGSIENVRKNIQGSFSALPK